MGSMPGTMGLGVISFVAVWALMMAAMIPFRAPDVAVGLVPQLLTIPIPGEQPVAVWLLARSHRFGGVQSPHGHQHAR